MFIIPFPVVLNPERYPDPWKSLVPIPTAVIEPAVPITAVTAAPAKGANPNPPDIRLILFVLILVVDFDLHQID